MTYSEATNTSALQITSTGSCGPGDDSVKGLTVVAQNNSNPDKKRLHDVTADVTYVPAGEPVVSSEDEAAHEALLEQSRTWAASDGALAADLAQRGLFIIGPHPEIPAVASAAVFERVIEMYSLILQGGNDAA